ncbi:MAG: IS200/IS605 family transposase [Deltaproteobacteria bacterium]|nr:IS200/IS605 family transposase [Deltaproteobacteria bacterium]
MAHSFANLLTHLIFSTKGRFPQIDQDLKPQLTAYMGGIIRELHGIALLIDGTRDHVHLLVRLPPTIALANVLRVLKANSSRWVHKRWPARADFAWQTGYGAFSVSQSNATAVLRYIANQEQHHRQVSFQQEMRTYLHKNKIDRDERSLSE